MTLMHDFKTPDEAVSSVIFHNPSEARAAGRIITKLSIPRWCNCDPSSYKSTLCVYSTLISLSKAACLHSVDCWFFLLSCRAVMESSKPHAALLSSPGLGHLIPMLELGKRLVTHHGFDVTVFTISASTSPAESQLLQSIASPQLLNMVELPPVDMSNLVDADAKLVTRIAAIMREIIPRFRTAISGMKARPTVLILDFFGFEALHILEFDMPKYIYFPGTAWFLSLSVYAPILDMEVEGEYVDRTEPLSLPGCKPVRPEDVVDPMLDRTNQEYLQYVRMGAGLSKCDGILLNTWEDLEPTTLRALRDEEAMAPFVKVPIYPIGPLTRCPGGVAPRELLDWLDLQPTESVIYVSFGSGGTITIEQLTELAWGLELSQHRFIWVVRPPIQNNLYGSYFTLGNGGDDPIRYLPVGFLGRTKTIGIVIPNWAPQVDILRHPSVGGFLSHCGWSSTLESIVNAVPMIAWPLFAEQRLNATIVTEDLGIAVRPEVLPTKRVVRREEIEKMVRRVMVDKEMRNRVKELKKSGESALSKGASSYNSLSLIAKD